MKLERGYTGRVKRILCIHTCVSIYTARYAEAEVPVTSAVAPPSRNRFHVTESLKISC